MSEFSGCGKALQGAFIINPYDVEQIAMKIDETINTSPQEKVARMEHMF